MGHERTTDATITVSEGPADARRSLIGRKLGAFTVVELIGGGGGGDVYRADQPELARSAVIKVMRARGRASIKRVERFLREARLASRLDHPYAAHIYSFGAEPDDLLWIAMEHVRGVTLSDLVERRGRVPLTVFAPFFERLCEVVRSAHELGIVHRDIKPSNVMVIERAGQLLPKLLDFGVAKGAIVDDNDSGAPSEPGITEQGTIVGTPGYMAPEQWAEPELVDHRTDIYALGVLAYRCIAGRDLFPDLPRAAIAAAHQNLEPDPLGVGPPELDEAIRKALAKDQQRRWAVATDLAAAVRKAIGGGVAEPVPPLDSDMREMWISGGPQPFAEAIATLADASTTVEADNAVRDVVDVACRWLAAIALAKVGDGAAIESLRDHARSVVGHADAATWLRLACAAAAITPTLTGLAEMFAKLEPLEQLAERISQARRSRNASVLREDIMLLGRALEVLTPLLEYRLVVGGDRGPELWMGRRTTVRERVVVWWNEEIAPGEVVLVDLTGKIALRLDPLVRAHRPLPHGDVELFLIASAGRGVARLAATPWGFELEDGDAGKLLDRLHGHDTSSGHTGDSESPYPGLAPYGGADAARFFGREHEVDALANRLIRVPRVAVLGPSGVGKSSFLHAGLAPRLAEHRVFSMRPGREPFAALARMLDCGPSSDAIVEALRSAAARATRGAVLLVDQLEELVTLADSDMRARFAELLGRLGDERVRVVVALRDDFTSMLESTDGLRDRFEPFVIGAPASSALRRILVEPARRAGFAFDDGVVDDIVAEVEGRAVALPLLGFTAARVWELRDLERKRLTRAAYNEIGGVGGAIATYADSVYASMGRREQAITRTLFGRLVAPDGTRVPVSRGDLDGLGDGSRAVVERLVEARLLATQETRDGGDEIVEPIHECLAERWPRLVRWRSEDAADRALIVDLRAAARRWESSSRSGDQLWRGPLLLELRRLAAGPMLLASEREFATASIAAEQRSRTRRRVLLAVAAVAISATAVVFAYLSRVADRSAVAAERRLTDSLVAHGRRELGEGRYDAALAYFGEALRRGRDTSSLRLLIGLASMPWQHQRLAYRGDFDNVVYPIDETWFAGGGPSGQVRWWNIDGSEGQVRELGSPILSLAPSPDEKQLVALVRGRAFFFDIAGGVPDHSVAVPDDVWRVRLGPADNEITLVRPAAIDIVDRNGRPLRTVTVPGGTARARTNQAGTEWVLGDTALTYLDLRTGAQRVIFAHTPTWLTATLDRRHIAFVDDEGAVHMMTRQGDNEKVFRFSARAEDLEFSRDGSQIGIVTNKALHVFSTDGVPVRVLQLGEISFRVFTLDGDDVWVGGEDGMLYHWHGERMVAAFFAHRTSIDMVSRAGPVLLTSGSDGTVIAWDPKAAPIAVGDEVCAGPYAKRKSSSLYLLSIVRCDQERGAFVGVSGHVVPVARPYDVWVGAPSPGGRVAFATETRVEVVDRTGARVASREIPKVSDLVFTDEDTVMIASGRRLQRWTVSTNQLVAIHEQITSGTISALAWAAPALIVGDDQGNVLRIADGTIAHTAKFSLEVRYVMPSRDGKWLALKLDDGSNPILRVEDLARVSELPRGGDMDAPPAFDPSGEFVVRAGDTGISVFERATGELLVTLRELAGAVDDPLTDTDAMRVMIHGTPASFPLVPDRRPVAEILHDIDCRVGLRVHGATLRDAPTVTCK